MTRIASLALVLALAACHGDTCARGEPVLALSAPAAPAAAPPSITVSGSAEILTAPDTFELSIGFDVQADALADARDESRRRAAALLAVVARHAIPPADVQTLELSLQPRHDNYERRKIIGYQASRTLIVTLRDLDLVEPVLYDMLAAGANRVDRVQLHSSAVRERRAEARVLAVEAARAKAEAMAAALGQQLGEPLRIEEDGAGGWRPPVMNNFSVGNDTVPEMSETVATGRIRVQAGVSVTFALGRRALP